MRWVNECQVAAIATVDGSEGREPLKLVNTRCMVVRSLGVMGATAAFKTRSILLWGNGGGGGGGGVRRRHVRGSVLMMVNDVSETTLNNR